MAGKECWSVGKGRGKVLPNLGGGGGSVMRRRRRPTQGSPPTQECSAICLKRARFHALQAALTKPRVFSQHIFLGHAQGAKLRAGPRVGRVRGSRGSIPVLPEAKPSVDSATKAEGGTGAGLGEHGESSKCESWGLWGGYTEEVWHPNWALKNEEVVGRQGQWGRHLAEGTARAKAERREIAWRV